MRFSNQPKKKSSLSVYAFVDSRLIFPFNVILMRIIHIEIDKKHFYNDFWEWLEKKLILFDKIWMVEPNAWLKKMGKTLVIKVSNDKCNIINFIDTQGQTFKGDESGKFENWPISAKNSSFKNNLKCLVREICEFVHL